MLPVTAFYAAPLALAFVVLSTRVIRARRLYQQPLGTAHRLVERAARAHGNFAEAAPLALLLLALCEANGLPSWALHVLGVTLLAGRGFHALGIGREPEVFRWRVLGTGLTLTMIGTAGAAAMGLALAALF
ncbi:glutathione metabolism protein [Roseomonas frigidaquae]|uniref:Glutathione metabolism protein n=1 Tax=Falsiroseomonas frigidaquae TaxID=487318 RepID=A0ABX1EZU2_9PROT|nr:MAPEG family protein [Falsiroseomonas frigidaquae]NKE45602.1 glutathione metabolism protein [Falsiroseomonas frigidaquae]